MCCCKQIPVLQTNWWTGGEQKEKMFILFEDDQLLLPGVCSFCWNFSERQILWSLYSVDFHTFTLQLSIQTPHSVAPELQVFVSSLKISAKRAHPGAESLKEIDGQVANRRRKSFYFAMMICCCWCISVLQGHLGTSREPKEKMFILCDDDPLLQTDSSPSNKLMDRWRTEGENVSTLRWWSVAADGSPSFKDIDGQVEKRKRKCFYFAMTIYCRWSMCVL